MIMTFEKWYELVWHDFFYLKKSTYIIDAIHGEVHQVGPIAIDGGQQHQLFLIHQKSTQLKVFEALLGPLLVFEHI